MLAAEADPRHGDVTLLICLESHGAEKRAGTRDSCSGCCTVTVQLIWTLLPRKLVPSLNNTCYQAPLCRLQESQASPVSSLVVSSCDIVARYVRTDFAECKCCSNGCQLVSPTRQHCVSRPRDGTDQTDCSQVYWRQSSQNPGGSQKESCQSNSQQAPC